MITVIGGGLAGVEAAWRLGRAGEQTLLLEMRPVKLTPAHQTGRLGELVCSNSLKSDSLTNAAGLLKAEMECLDSLVMKAARANAVPAGSALAVDRQGFADFLTREIESLAAVEVRREEVTAIPASGPLIIATGPLTTEPLARAISQLTGRESLHFYDAIAPIVFAESVDRRVAFRASRWGKGEDYINCPMTREEYEKFVDALLSARRVPRRDFEEEKFFEGCLPIEVMAERGREVPAFGPMKPVGLTDPRTGKRPYAVVQLRQDDREGRLLNMVGFQTRLAWPEQERVFRMIPGLERAEFVRLGSVHRNTFLQSPRLLNPDLSLRRSPQIFFAGQLTGVEGYLPSAATGIIAAINALRRRKHKPPLVPPASTMIGALLAYISDPSREHFQPMNANFGIIAPPPQRLRRSEKKSFLVQRALAQIRDFARAAEE